MRIVFSIILFLTICISCQKTAENSKYKDSILALDEKAAESDSLMKQFNEINHEAVFSIIDSARVKYDNARKGYISDTVILPYDNALAIMKGNFVKGLGKIKFSNQNIQKEYIYNKSQYESLRENLINETFFQDTVTKYVNSELNAMNDFILNIKWYNSKANYALTEYNNVSEYLDSIVSVYGNK